MRVPVPSEATIPLVLMALPPDTPPWPWTARPARIGRASHQAVVHLLSISAPATPVGVPGDTSEIDALTALPIGLDPSGMVATAGALRTRTETAAHRVGQPRAEYVFIAKADRRPFGQFTALPGDR